MKLKEKSQPVHQSEKLSSDYRVKSDDDSSGYYSEEDEDINIPNHIK